MKLNLKHISALIASFISINSVPFTDTFSTVHAYDTEVFINEVCTQNKACLADSYGTYSDWIELYNSGNTSADISGYGISDKADTPLKWTFPDNTIIEPKSYLIVFASKQASINSEMHTGFALSKNGETLVFSSPNGTIMQTVNIPTLGEDRTYGRTPDGSSVFEIMDATPGKSNIAVVSAPTFSESSGFYGTDFSLKLSSAEGTEIYYTTDGSNPTKSSTASIYSDAITINDRTNTPNIYSSYEENESNVSIARGVGYKNPTFNVDKATVVCAAAKNSDGSFSRIVSQTYFITTGNLSKYKDATVISMVTSPDNLFDPDTGIYVTGNQYIEWKNSSSYDPNKSVWDTDNVTNYFSKGRAWEREASITIFENGIPIVEQNMGIRIKGASTRNGAQKSFNLYARSDYGASKIENALLTDNYSFAGKLIDKYDSISLRSVSDEVRLRDGFAQGLINNRENITTQNMKPCVLFLNGEYWGLYMMTEKLSDYFIESNYGIQKENVAMIKSNELEEGTLEELNSFINFAKTYSKKDLTNSANYDAVCSFIDIESMIEHYAAGIYLGTFDWPNYNYGVWRNTGDVIDGNPYSDGKWRFITYDLDYTMGATYGDFGGVMGYEYDNFRHMDNSNSGTPTCLFVALLQNKEFRDKFVTVYCDYANEVLSEETAKERVGYYSQNYSDLISNTMLRWWGFFGGTPSGLLPYYKSEYQNKTLNNINTFFSKRPEYTLEDMKEYLNLSGELQTITIKTKGNGKVQIGTITPDTSNGSWSGRYFSDCPVTITAIPDDDSSFTGWEGNADGNSPSITLTLKEAMTIEAVFKENEFIRGDVNSDGIFSIADIIMMQKYLLNTGSLKNKKAGDLYEDDKINIFDLSVMKEDIVILK